MFERQPCAKWGLTEVVGFCAKDVWWCRGGGGVQVDTRRLEHAREENQDNAPSLVQVNIIRAS